MQYVAGEKLALNLDRSKAFGDATVASFERLARKAGVLQGEIRAMVETATERTVAAWRHVSGENFVQGPYRTRVEEHLERLKPLLGRQ